MASAAAMGENVAGWHLQDAAKVDATGEQISMPSYRPSHWYKAIVPGTVLTSLVADGVYPEPLYGENNRKIPETLCHTSYWYRATFRFQTAAPESPGHDWIRFNGINYQAEVFVNGHDLGPIKGAFVRKEFDVTPYLIGGGAAIAVHVYPPPHPGTFHEHTAAAGTGRNGGAMGQDGATFVATVGWDWVAGIRDRDTGIWQSVETIRTGAIRILDPYITTDFDVNNPVKATVSGEVTIENLDSKPWHGKLDSAVERVGASSELTLQPHQRLKVKIPQIVVDHPKLWWPNGYGIPNLYTLRLGAYEPLKSPPDVAFEVAGLDVPFGIKKYGYFVPGSKNLTITVNGVKVFCKGGNWGLDEAMKRIPYARLDAEVRMHRDANLNMIRNWVGQSTEEDFYRACDKYGIMVWDDFWLANPADGPIPNDNALFMANAREKVLRFRNHPSIAVWCGRNEADPPPVLNKGLKDLIQELDPSRFYQPNSASYRTPTNGVGGGGPYQARPVASYFTARDGMHTEIGMPSIPTLESIEGMMPLKDLNPDWSKLNDDFAEHDLCRGAQNGPGFVALLGQRYGPISSLADFVRKSQLENYEGYRAMFEGRQSHLFDPATGTLLWMSAPAQPSFVWQLFAHDLEPDAALFGAEKACEPIHIQYDPVTRTVEVVNTTGRPLLNVIAHEAAIGLDGWKNVQVQDAKVDVPASSVRTVLKLPADAFKNRPGFLLLQLGRFSEFQKEVRQSSVISENFYWEPAAASPGDLTSLEDLPPVALDIEAKQLPAEAGRVRYRLFLQNRSGHAALAVHVQLRRKRTGKRVLPVFYSDNYVSFAPIGSKLITIEAAKGDLGGEPPLITLDGWNVRVGKVTGDVAVEENTAMRAGKNQAIRRGGTRLQDGAILPSSSQANQRQRGASA